PSSLASARPNDSCWQIWILYAEFAERCLGDVAAARVALQRSVAAAAGCNGDGAATLGGGCALPAVAALQLERRAAEEAATAAANTRLCAAPNSTMEYIAAG
ncbi:unnamed protein product, partial [Phaeothamnion confervicola]